MSAHSIKLLAAALVLCAPVQIGGAAAAGRPFEGKDLFALQSVSDPQIRKDGRAVVYVRQSNDLLSDRRLQSLWEVDTETGAQTPISANPGSDSSPRWSPDGERIAYLHSEGGRPSQLVVRWVRTGNSTVITHSSESPSDIAWSPDGRSIAFVMLVPEPEATLGRALTRPEGAHWAEPLQVIENMNFQNDNTGEVRRGYSHVFVVSADGGTSRQLTFGPYSEAGPLSWSPDGREILLSGNRTAGWENEPVDPGRRLPVDLMVYRLRITDGQLTPLTSPTGSYHSAAFSPDGTQIAFLGFDNSRRGIQDERVIIMDREGQHLHSVSDALDRSIIACQWAADGRGLLIEYTDEGITKIEHLSLEGRRTPVATGLAPGDAGDVVLPYTGGAFSAAALTGAVAYTGGASDRPPELFLVNGHNTTKLTHLNDELFGEVQLGRTTPLKVSSSFDHRPIDAWMITPPDFDPRKKYPLILEIHGGPYASYGPIFAAGHQLYAAAGYIVVYANPRGSTSYGEAFANLVHNDYPSHDYDDLMSAVDAAIETGHVDADNLFVAGHSGGGVLTAWIVGATHRFRAAASQDPVIDWTSGMLTSDISPYVLRYWFDKMPWEDPEGYWKHSPLSRVGEVTTPTLVVVGSEDLRTPVGEAEQFYLALKLRGVPTTLIKVPGAYHEVSRPSQYVARSNAILAWFERYSRGSTTDKP
jgi:dipeptidyl aminopeptidase/acylaminoacyl peptidase